MPQALAYHSVVHALEGRAGWTSRARFACAISHAIEGHLPYARYHAAGERRESLGAAVGAIERAVEDWLSTDLNPAMQTMLTTRLTSNVVWAYNAYNESANLAVRTSVGSAAASLSHEVAGARVSRTVGDDPTPCRAGTLAV